MSANLKNKWDESNYSTRPVRVDRSSKSRIKKMKKESDSYSSRNRRK